MSQPFVVECDSRFRIAFTYSHNLLFRSNVFFRGLSFTQLGRLSNINVGGNGE